MHRIDRSGRLEGVALQPCPSKPKTEMEIHTLLKNWLLGGAAL
jgi:hypothetical protein